MTTASIKGEVTLEDGDESLLLVFNVESFIVAEALLDGKSTYQIINDLERSGTNFTALRAILHGAMQRHHKGPPSDASGVIDRLGYATVYATVMVGLNAAFGPAEGGDNSNPPRKGQTGSSGTKAGAKQD